MIPLKDNIPSRHFPIVNLALIVANVAIFLYELSLAPKVESFLQAYSVIPYNLTVNSLSLVTLRSLISAQFLHAGWMHLLGNMLFLYIFGDNVEDRLGHGKYLVFYLFCGLISFITQVMTMPNSMTPLLGASGAIAGVLGAYFILFPTARVLTFIPIFFFFRIIELPAFFFLGFWFLYQFLLGSVSLGHSAMGGVAFWAHIGGFICGIVLITIYKVRKRGF